jgi:Cu/Ag efflux protein CusF
MPNNFNSSLPRLALFCLCALLTFPAACNRGTSQPAATPASSAAKRYAFKGKVISIDKQAGIANINNEPIPGFMDPMVMPYTINPASVLDQLQPGDSITADVVVESEKYWLENVQVTAHKTPAEKPAASVDGEGRSKEGNSRRRA